MDGMAVLNGKWAHDVVDDSHINFLRSLFEGPVW